MYLDLAIIVVHISCGFCFVSYNLFEGFDPPVTNSTVHNHKKTTLNSVTSTQPTTMQSAVRYSSTPIKPPKFNCSEDERPFNIGTYEVPTQKDLVQLIQKTLIRMFNVYQDKALYFLKDIQQATQATSDIEKKCYSSNRNYIGYRMCVKQVSNKCEVITKNLITSLERQRLDVSAFIEGTICNVTVMKTDPVELIKTLAMEEASLEFALPGFLRLLGACSVYCDKRYPKTLVRRSPLRHMTDQDLVVKHFLTKKNYLQLIKGSK